MFESLHQLNNYSISSLRVCRDRKLYIIWPFLDSRLSSDLYSISFLVDFLRLADIHFRLRSASGKSYCILSGAFNSHILELYQFDFCNLDLWLYSRGVSEADYIVSLLSNARVSLPGINIFLV